MTLVRLLYEDGIEPNLREQVHFRQGPFGGFPNVIRTIARRRPVAKAPFDLTHVVMPDNGTGTPEFNRLLGDLSCSATGWNVGKHV